MVITLGQQYNVGEKPTVILYTYINLVRYMLGKTVFLRLTIPLWSTLFWTTLVSRVFGCHDRVYRDTITIYRFHIRLWFVFTSSLLNRPPAQHHLSRVRPILRRTFPLHKWGTRRKGSPTIAGEVQISLSPFTPGNSVSRDRFGRPVASQPAYSPNPVLLWYLLTGPCPSWRFPRRCRPPHVNCYYVVIRKWIQCTREKEWARNWFLWYTIILIMVVV